MEAETSTVPTGKHAPVFNQPEMAPPPEAELMSDPPQEGVNPRTNPVSEEGLEVVEGYVPVATELAALSTIPEGGEAAVIQRRVLEEVPGLWMAPNTTGLSDIGEASFGSPLALEAVIGTDDRVQITNTTAYPWRVHASLLITAADNSPWIGTGWFIGPHTLITAGHVVHIKNNPIERRNGWVTRIKVMPGRNGGSLPFGSVTSTTFWSVKGWTEDGDQNYDYGAIILPTDLGATTGWIGFGVWPDAQLLSSLANISGYPGDKPAGTQWYHSRKITSVNGQKVFYDIDTAGGQSGSAVYRIVNGVRYGVAIHAYGGTTANSGTRITSPVYNNLTAWKA
jgi:glutamyl endopeptidase